MTDQRPPALAADERTTLTTALQFQRDSILRNVEGVDEADARHSPVGSGTSLLWLVRHVRRAELVWVSYRFADRAYDLPDPDDEVGTLDDAVELYRAAWSEVDEIVAAASLDDVTARQTRGQSVNLRWILVHLIEEIARHAGHADILRELIDGQVGR